MHVLACCDASKIHFVAFSSVVDCGPQTPRPGSGGLMVNQPNTTFNSTITYSCQVVGYTLNGSSERVCQANGSFSGVEPSCISELLDKALMEHFFTTNLKNHSACSHQAKPLVHLYQTLYKVLYSVTIPHILVYCNAR